MRRIRSAFLATALAAFALVGDVDSRSPALSDSLVTGLWRLDAPRPGADSDAVHRSRFTLYLAPDHTWESMLWVEDKTGPQPDFIGIRATGTWSLQEGTAALTALDCTGFTASGRKECALESDEIGDTDYFGVKEASGLKHLVTLEPTLPLTLPFAGKVRDMAPPSYWPGTLSLRGKAKLPWHGPATDRPSTFDILGRHGPGAAAGRLYPAKASPSPPRL